MKRRLQQLEIELRLLDIAKELLDESQQLANDYMDIPLFNKIEDWLTEYKRLNKPIIKIGD